ncbi:MAG TPA: NAD(P)H-hydrate dehydratase [Steroidobacteraceae bacterium]
MPDLPLELYSAAQVRALDRHAIETAGIPSFVLMTRAGAAAFDALRKSWPTARRILVACGAGNNGGDGYVVARLAKAESFDVSVAALAGPERLKGDARRAFDECRAAGVPIGRFDPAALTDAEVIVDALLGTGLDRPLDAGACAIVGHINSSEKPVLAIDLPSGLNADTGAVMGAVVRATRTISFIGLKLGCFLGEGPSVTGTLEFASLDVPAAPAGLARPTVERIDRDLIARVLPRRRRTAHKGEFGHVLIVGGNEGMAGAVQLCGEACLRSGAGLVSIATRPAHAVAVTAARPELMCHGVAEPQSLRALIERADVIAIGPGLGRDPWARSLFEVVLDGHLPVVLDADALNLLAESPHRREDWILTPHPGEAARLLGVPTAEVQNDRFATLRQLNGRFGGVVVLKGACTLIGFDDATPSLCDRGNPGMATAGMGDVLTGVLAALRAQIGDPWNAARAAVLAHALAGDEAAKNGERGLIASDLIARLPACLNPRRSN